MATRLEGPFSVPPEGGMLAPSGHFADRIGDWRGLALYFCQRTAELDWPGFRRAAGKYVAPPLAVSQWPDGSLALSSFQERQDYQLEAPRSVVPQDVTLYRRRPLVTRVMCNCEASSGMDVLVSTDSARVFLLEGEIRVDGSAGGFAFGLDEQGAG